MKIRIGNGTTGPIYADLEKAMNKYVDLGLPSGTLWTAMNVGAESIVGYGDYFNHKEAMECDITLPTKEQFRELIGNATYKWVENYNNCGVNGGLFIGKNGNEVFFPGSGYRLHGSAHLQSHCGFYWSNSLFSNKNSAYTLSFASGSVDWQYGNFRDIGFPLRGVKNK